MAKICYVPKRFERTSKNIIQKANVILQENAAAGFNITLRTLYYRFVAAGWILNKQKAYKRLGSIVGDARLAGLIDWDHLSDRTRNLSLLRHYSSPQSALSELSQQYHIDLWENQRYRPEVWIEKDALVGVIERVCDENDVPFFSCRGYTSLSEMWSASMRLSGWRQAKQTPYVIHFGDHDPSGIDMSRDILDRIQKTFGVRMEFKRVALNMDQIERYQPPPNPAKTTDSRFKDYQEKFGDESWELDALPPPSFREIIEGEIKRIRDDKQWKSDLKEKAKARARLVELSNDWDSIPGLKESCERQEATIAKMTLEIARLSRKRKKPDA